MRRVWGIRASTRRALLPWLRQAARGARVARGGGGGIIPPTPPRRTIPEPRAPAADKDQALSPAPVPQCATCPNCFQDIEHLGQDKDDISGDYYLIDDEAWCRYCHGALSDCDEK